MLPFRPVPGRYVVRVFLCVWVKISCRETIIPDSKRGGRGAVWQHYGRLFVGLAVGAFIVGFIVSVIAFGPGLADEDDCVFGSRGFVGLHDEHVAIFAGEPDGCQRLVETKPIGVEQLLSFVVADLERGIVFADEAEMFQILEGLSVR